jgi:hypothetical protein
MSVLEIDGVQVGHCGTPLCLQTCPCFQSLTAQCLSLPAVHTAVAAACTYAKCTRTHKVTTSCDGENDCVEGCWTRLQSCAARLQESPDCRRVLAAVLSAVYSMDLHGHGYTSHSLVWLTISHHLSFKAMVAAQRLKWLFHHGACAEQGFVSEAGRLTCRPACVASVNSVAVMDVMTAVGFRPSRRFFCSGGSTYGKGPIVKWHRWHERRSRRQWCVVVQWAATP